MAGITNPATRDPLGLLIELASYRFEPPIGHTHADVLLEAHLIRTERGDYNIAPEHLADAIVRLVAHSQRSLSGDRTSGADPYRHARPDAPEATESPPASGIATTSRRSSLATARCGPPLI